MTKDTLEKVKTGGVIMLMGIILSVLGVMSVLLMPVVWVYHQYMILLQRRKDYITDREDDTPNYLSGKPSIKKTRNDKTTTTTKTSR